MNVHGKVNADQKKLDAVRSDLAQLSLIKRKPVVLPKPPANARPIIPVPAVTSEEQPRLAAISSAMSTRIAWDRILREFSLVLPSDVTLTSLTLNAPAAPAAPGVAAPAASGQGLNIAGDVLLLLCGWFLLIGPQRSTAASIERATQAAEVQLVEAKKPVKAPTPAAVEKQPVIRTADLYSIAKAMPSDEDMPDLLLQLDQVARSAGVTLKSIAPAPAAPSATASFSTVPIQLAFSGDFYSLTDMLYRLRSLVTV